MTASAPSRTSPKDPWAKYGWIAQSIWLLFLIFPILGVAQAGLGTAATVAAYGIIAVFAVIYAVCAKVLEARDKRGHSIRGLAFACIAALCALGFALYLMVGFVAVGLAPFVVSFGMFVLPIGWSMGFGAAVVILTWVLIFVDDTTDDGSWVVGIIVLAVAVMTAAMRVVIDRSNEEEALNAELSLVAERERVARDVHDVLGHSLTALTVKAELAERMLDLDVERARAEIQQIQDISRTALAEIRATVGGLRVARLADELDNARDALESKGISADVPTDVTVVDPRHRILFAWVLREATTNVIRHSGARSCTVELASNRIVVTDDGTGIGTHEAGNGIRGLGERVAAANARLNVGDRVDGGTRLEVIA